jgi:hypothetical protein
MKLKSFSIKNFLSITVLSVFLLSYSAFSQDDDFENYRFDDDKTSNQKTPYFALSFGGTASFLFMNYDDINSRLKCSDPTCKVLHPSLEALEFSGPIVGLGFNFFTALSPLVNNARLGISYFFFFYMKEFDEKINSLSPEGDIIHFHSNHNRKLSVSNVGLHFDYAFVPLKSLAILPGIGVKGGTMTLEHYETILPRDWNETPPTLNYNLLNEKLEYSYIAFEPQLNIEYALTGFLMFRASGSYMFAMDNPFYKNAWTINGNNSYTGVPKSVKPQGFSVTLGLYLGLFNY